MSLKTENAYVLIPGWTRSNRSYQRFIDARPADTQIIFARHPEITPSGTIEEFKNRFPEFLDKHHIEHATLIGQSAGGALALEYALIDQGNRIRELILVSSSGINGKETAVQLFKNWLKNLLESGGDKLWYSVTNFDDPWRVLMHYRLARYAAQVDFQTRGHQLTIPTTVIGAENDVMNPAWQAQLLHQSLPTSRLIILPGGHDLIIRHPQLIWQKLLESK